MATHDYVIDNSTGANVRADINNVLQAILTNNSNSSAPSTTAAYQWWADTNANVFKIRNSANNAWITLFTLAGGVDVDAASNFAATVTFTDDVTFDGATAGRDIVFDRSQNALEFLDNAVAKFGTDADASLFHDGGNLHFQNTTGTFKIKGDDIHLQRSDGNEECLTAAANGAIGAFFDNELKLSTVTGGIQVHNIANNAGILLSGTGNNTGVIFTSTADSPDNGYRLSFHSVSATRHNDEYLAIDKTDAAGTGGIETITTFTVGGQHFDDNKIIHLGGTGATGDLLLYHDGSAGRIHSPSHPLYFRVGGQFGVFKGNGTESKILAEDDGTAQLFFDNEVKLETLTDGAQCRGVMHVLSQDGNVIQHTEAFYLVIGTSSSSTITLTGLIGSGRFVIGGYANAGQGAIAFNAFFGGAMFATQHYNVNVLQNSAMQNTAISTSKNNTSYVITITNNSSSSSLGLSGFLESTGSQMSFAFS